MSIIKVDYGEMTGGIESQWLFNDGDDYSAITGGYSYASNNGSKIDDGEYIGFHMNSLTQSYWARLNTTNKIDFSKYNTLIFKGSLPSDTGLYLYLYTSDSLPSSAATPSGYVTRYYFTKGVNTWAFNISSLNDSYRIVLHTYWNNAGDYKWNKIILLNF